MAIGKRINSAEEPPRTGGPDFEIGPPAFSIEDLVLPEATREALLDFLAYRDHEQLVFERWGLAETHRRVRQTAVNFYGPPGTGKTMAAHAVASHFQRPLLAVNYADIESKYVGDTPKNLTRAFETARKSGAILFFDEADAILSRRVTNMSHATDVSVNQTRSVLLMLMNDWDGIVVFATNFIENYDPAFMRRILAHIRFDLPDLASRVALWRQYMPAALPTAMEPAVLAEMSEGFSGSDIRSAVLKAAMSAARAERSEVEPLTFEAAIRQIRESKRANQGRESVTRVEDRVVSEAYVRQQLSDAPVQRQEEVRPS